MRVLVVDDDRIAMEQAVTALENHGYEVVKAHSDKDAVSLLRKRNEVDIIISEVVTSGMDGFHLLTYLKAESRLSRIPVVLCTASNDIRTVKRALALGAVGFITKPIHAETLVEKVHIAEERIPGSVVVVDDEDILRNLLHNALTRDGIRVLAAESGRKALELIEQNNTVLVVSDIKMPQMNGLELLENIKEKYPKMPVFLMAGQGEDFNKKQVMAAGADGFITKPFKNIEIIRQIRPFVE